MSDDDLTRPEGGDEREAPGVEPESKLEMGAEPYVSLFQQLPLPCIETTLRGTMRRANVAAANFFNVHVSFLIAKPLLHFVARGDCDAFRAAVECVASGKSLDRIALRFRPRRRQPVSRVKLSAQRLRGVSRPTIVWIIDCA
jgi:PAS domain-containing protein